MANADKIIAAQLESAGNTVSGLHLADINDDGHAVANRLWRIAAYLRTRSSQENENGIHHSTE